MALEISDKNMFSKEIFEANELLGKAYEELEQYDLSLLYNRNLLKIKDSIFTVEKLKTETKTADKIQIDFMNDEIRRQDEKIEELNENVNRSEITVILTSAFLTIISLLAVSLYREDIHFIC